MNVLGFHTLALQSSIHKVEVRFDGDRVETFQSQVRHLWQLQIEPIHGHETLFDLGPPRFLTLKVDRFVVALGHEVVHRIPTRDMQLYGPHSFGNLFPI